VNHQTRGKILVVELLGGLNLLLAAAALPLVVRVEDLGADVIFKQVCEIDLLGTHGASRGCGALEIDPSSRKLEGNVEESGGLVALVSAGRTSEGICRHYDAL
jgi:hypothetical protein